MIKIHYQDDECIVVEKPANLLTHPSKESKERENLLFATRDMINTYLYPIHRLDRQTSGIVIFGKKKEFIKDLQKTWHTKDIQKKYITLVNEEALAAAEYSFALKCDNGEFKAARTAFKPICHYSNSTLLEVEIFTGRRHQIRRHFSRRMQHIAGDRKYGKKKINDFYLNEFGLKRLFLHAHSFSFIHPNTRQIISINSDLPQDLQEVLHRLK